MARGHNGRRSTLEIIPEVQDLLCEQIKAGMPIRYACAQAGVSEAAFHLWVSKGSEPDAAPHYVKFLEAVTRARGEKVHRLLKSIEDAGGIESNITGQRDWKAHAWLLERGEPELFSPKQKTEVTGKDGGPVQFESVSDVLAKARAARAKREGK